MPINTLTNAAKDLMNLSRGGSYSISRDVIKHRVYDTRYFSSTATSWTFFTQQIGQAWRVGNKSKVETNMFDAGKLPNGQVMIWTRMGIQCKAFPALDESAPDDLAQSFYNMLDSSVFEVKIQGRDFDYQIHGSEFLPALHISGNIATNNPVRVGEFYATGWSSLNPTPIILDQLVGFSVDHTFSNPDTNIQTIINAAASALNTANSVMTVTLEGLLTRAK